jgi:tRNA(fMet)-specific endonuclease VapC
MFVILDTNHLREYALGSRLGANLKTRIEQEQAEVFTSIVCAEESLQGWISFVRRHMAGPDQLEGYQRLQDSITVMAAMLILPFDQDASNTFLELKRQGIRIHSMDLKIATIAMIHDALLLSRNLVDFAKVPGLRVENWLD